MTLSRVLIAEHAAVASENPLASMGGYDVLKNGGNAFDAAAAVSFTLAVTMHHIGGLGGDFFGMLYEAKTGKVHCLNSSGWSPSGLTSDLAMSKGGKVPIYGPLSCVVPGQVAGVCSMHERFGLLSLRELLRTPGAYARGGFPATEGYCRSTSASLEFFTPEAASVFAPGGRQPSPGDWIRQEALGKLIDEIAAEGSRAFYSGPPAEAISETLTDLGVPTSPQDFRDFRPDWVAPLVLDYKGSKVFEVPPNSMGATSLLMLKLLAGKNLERTGPLSRERMEATMDAAEVAYGRKDKMLGDPRFSEIDLEEFMDTATGTQAYAGVVSEGDTTAFSVVDREGNLVSAIQSLFRHFGSRVFVPACGIMLNDRASGFSIEGPNKVAPRKRPLHTLSSLIIEKGEDTRVAIGSSGGDFRPMQHTLFMTNLVDYDMALEQVVDHPRFLWSEGRSLIVEEGFEDFGPPRYDAQVYPMPGKTGVCQAVELRGRTRKAVCDVRGDGLPAGY